MTAPYFFTLKTATEVTGLSYSRLLGAIRTGRLEAVREGKSYLIRNEHLLAFLSRQELPNANRREILRDVAAHLRRLRRCEAEVTQ